MAPVVAPSERAQGQRLVRAISAHLADGTLRKAFVDLTRKFIMQEGARVRATKAQAHLNAGGIDGFTGLGGMFCLDGVGLAGIAGGAGGDSMFPTLYCDEAVGTDELWAPDECLDDSLGPPLAFEGIPSNGSGAYTGGYMGGYMGGRGGGGIGGVPVSDRGPTQGSKRIQHGRHTHSVAAAGGALGDRVQQPHDDGGKVALGGEAGECCLILREGVDATGDADDRILLRQVAGVLQPLGQRASSVACRGGLPRAPVEHRQLREHRTGMEEGADGEGVARVGQDRA